MPKPIIWVIVADGARARLFQVDQTQQTLSPASGEELIGSNSPSRDIASDRPAGPSTAAARGGLRAAMPQQLREAVGDEVAKDLPKLPPRELQDHLRDVLEAQRPFGRA